MSYKFSKVTAMEYEIVNVREKFIPRERFVKVRKKAGLTGLENCFICERLFASIEDEYVALAHLKQHSNEALCESCTDAVKACLEAST